MLTLPVLFRGRDISAGIATRYGLDGPGIESRWGEIFRTHPDRPWGTPSLLYNGYRVFLGGKTAGAWCWLPTPSSVNVKERVELYFYSPSGPLWPVIGWPLPLHFYLSLSYLSTRRCPNWSSFKFSKYNSRGFCQVCKACNTRRASYSNQISNPNDREQRICDALQTRQAGCICQHQHTEHKEEESKKLRLFQIEDSGLLALQAASGGNTLPTDILQCPERLDRSARPLWEHQILRGKHCWSHCCV